MSIVLNNVSILESQIDKARKQMKQLNKEPTRQQFVENAIEYYIDALKKDKVIK